MDTVLVICIGNTARGDDGVAHEVARLVSDGSLPEDVRLLTSMGLDIAMAADVADATSLVIVDAIRRKSPAVEVRRIAASPSSAPTGHGIDPAGLLSLAGSLYGHVPPTLLVSVAAPEMNHGEGLSDTAGLAAREAAESIAEIIRSSLPRS